MSRRLNIGYKVDVKICSFIQVEFDVLLKWYATFVKFSGGDYKDEFVRVCELLQQKAKGDKEKKQRFIQVVVENRSFQDNLSVLLDALIE